MSYSDITPGINLTAGPGIYMRSCLKRTELVPGINYEAWCVASVDAAHMLPNEQRMLPPSPWPEQVRERRLLRSRLGYNTKDLHEKTVADDGALSPISVYMNYLIGFMPEERQPEMLRQAARESLLLEFAARNAMLTYAANQGAQEYERFSQVDIHAGAEKILTEAEAAIARYNAALRQAGYVSRQ